MKITVLPPKPGVVTSTRDLDILTAKLFRLINDVKEDRRGTPRLGKLIRALKEDERLDLRVQIAEGRSRVDLSEFSAEKGGPIYLYLNPCLPPDTSVNDVPRWAGLGTDRIGPLLVHELVHVVETVSEHSAAFPELSQTSVVRKVLEMRWRLLRRFPRKLDKSPSTSETDQWTIPRAKAMVLLGFELPYLRMIEGQPDAIVVADFLGYMLWGRAETDIHAIPADPTVLQKLSNWRERR